MLTIIYGVPGSGKSYKIALMIRDFIKKYKDTVIITNFDTLDIDKLSNTINEDIQVTFNQLTNEKLKGIYQKMASTFSKEELQEIEKVTEQIRKTFNITSKRHVLFAFDEAHLIGFDTSSDFLVKFLSMHRHITDENIQTDIILATQTHTQIHTNLRKVAETFIFTTPPTERLKTNLFEYHYFTAPQLVEDYINKRTTKNRVRLERIKPSQEIFDSYKSGSVQYGHSDLRRKLYLYLAVLSIITLIVSYRLYTFVSSNNDNKDTQHSKHTLHKHSTFKKKPSLNHLPSNYEVVRRVALCSHPLGSFDNVEDCLDYEQLMKKRLPIKKIYDNLYAIEYITFLKRTTQNDNNSSSLH